MWLNIIVPSAAVGSLLNLAADRDVRAPYEDRTKHKRHSKGPPVIKGSYPGTNGRLTGGAQPQQQQMEMNALLPPSSLSEHSQGSSGVGLVSAASANNCKRIPVPAPEYPLHVVCFHLYLGEGAFGKFSQPVQI
jgi:hypothetical protein